MPGCLLRMYEFFTNLKGYCCYDFCRVEINRHEEEMINVPSMNSIRSETTCIFGAKFIWCLSIHRTDMASSCRNIFFLNESLNDTAHIEWHREFNTQTCTLMTTLTWNGTKVTNIEGEWPVKVIFHHICCLISEEIVITWCDLLWITKGNLTTKFTWITRSVTQQI